MFVFLCFAWVWGMQLFTLEARIRVRGPLGAWGWGTALLASRGRGRGSAGPQPVWDRVDQVTQPPVSPATWGARLALQGPRDPGRGVREVTQPVFTKLLRQEPDAGAPGVGTQTDAHLVGARREARGNGPVWGGGCRGHRCSAWGAARRAGPWRIDGQARGALRSGGEAWSCRKNRASVRCDAVPGCRHALGLSGRVSQDGATAAHPDNCTVAASFGSRAVLGTVPRPHTCSRTHTRSPKCRHAGRPPRTAARAWRTAHEADCFSAGRALPPTARRSGRRAGHGHTQFRWAWSAGVLHGLWTPRGQRGG